MYPGSDEPEPEVVEVIEEKSEQSGNLLAEPLLGSSEPVLDPVLEASVAPTRPNKYKVKADKARRYFEAHFSKAVIGTVWMIINILLFIEHWTLYYFTQPNLYITFAKGFGEVLNFNCALILIPVLRNFITALRQTFLYRFIPFDSNIMFHRRIAWAILVASYGHSIFHYMNFAASGTPWTLAWTGLATVTGNLLVFVMVVMYTTAIDSIRRRYFNVFYFAHHLFIVFFILLLLHGPVFWIWFLVPGIMYTLERVLREYRAKKATTVLQVTNHPSDVVELRMGKKGFKYKSGQYLYLNAPYLSYYEWHPFTITSAPHEEFVSVHIRAVGKWTKGIRKLLAPEEEGTQVINKEKGPDGRPLIRLDGPFGAASEEVFTFKTVVLVGAGIGVTPFASILKSLYYKKFHQSKKCKIEKAYFFWICREVTSLEWFQEMLRGLEVDMKERGDQTISLNIYLTERFPPDQLAEYKTQQQQMELDPVTGLEARTNFGRPDFAKAFDELREAHVGEKVGVFFCGPRVLSKDLRQLSMSKSAKRKREGAKFVFHKENF